MNKPTTMDKGKLYLIPAPISDARVAETIPAINQEIIRGLNIFITEEVKTAVRFLRQVGFQKRPEEVTFYVLNEHTSRAEYVSYLDGAERGKDVGLLSEAGMPCLADPGAGLVRLAHDKGIRVVPLSGPSAIVQALIASGMNGQNFIFHGYLPIHRHERTARLRELETDALRHDRTQVFIEAPYRNQALLESLLQCLKEHTCLCVATNIGSRGESISTMPVKEWKRRIPQINKQPAVFLIGRG
jgi:16S rRNA (cytidine1402-2'-O)-methyltransferase